MREAMDYEGVYKCETCDLPKPTICHHCSACNKCVIHLDHHCRKCRLIV